MIVVALVCAKSRYTSPGGARLKVKTNRTTDSSKPPAAFSLSYDSALWIYMSSLLYVQARKATTTASEEKEASINGSVLEARETMLDHRGCYQTAIEFIPASYRLRLSSPVSCHKIK